MAVRFRPGSEQPGNPAAINPLTLPRGRGTRGAEPTAYMSGFSRKVGIPTYHPPSGAKASWMGDKRTNRWRVHRLHSSSRLSAQRAHSPNPCASTAPLPQHSSVLIICLPHQTPPSRQPFSHRAPWEWELGQVNLCSPSNQHQKSQLSKK